MSGDKAGIVGFCLGGRLVLQTSLVAENVSVAIPFNRLPLTAMKAPQVKCPILGLYGADDGGIPVAGVRAMGDALTAAGIQNELIIYDGAPHSFFNDTRPSYRPDAAADAWERVLAALKG